MSAMRFLGLISVLALICGKGRTESTIPDAGQDQVADNSANAFSITIPLGNGNVIQSDNQLAPTVQRRLSLEDFFLNRNQQEPSQPAVEQQVPIAQFQVQQPDPNSVQLVRDVQFPSPTGGLISRLILARRMLRLRRIARRLTLIPRLMGLGLRGRSALASNPNPLSIFSNRIGEGYDPRDYVFGSKGFTYQNNATSDAQQQRDASTNTEQDHQQTQGYPDESIPYYRGVQDSNYDSLDNTNSYDPQELNELKKQREILNSLTDEQQVLLLHQLQTYQQQLNQLQQQLNSLNSNKIDSQNYKNQEQLQSQYQQPQANFQNVEPVQQQHNQPSVPIQQEQENRENQPQAFSDQQLEQLRQLQLQLLREQQLQQQLQQLQLAQQAQNLKQHQDLASIEQEGLVSNQQQNSQLQDSNIVGDRTEGSPYPTSIGIGGSPKGQTVGVGINVGIRPPQVDVDVIKPVSPVIKPLPPIINPISTKPVPVAKPEPPLVPIGILPKPMLNLRGRVFFGAEVGKGAGVKAGAGR